MAVVMQVGPDGPSLLRVPSSIVPVVREDVRPAKERLTVGKINLIRHSVKEAQRSARNFVLIESRRP